MNLLTLQPDQYSRYRIISEFISQIANGKGLKLLDVGGGNGNLEQFLDAKYDLTIVDENDEEKEGVIKGSCQKLPFKDKSFDVVIFSDVFEHVEGDERQQCLNELFRVSRDYVLIGAPFESKKVKEVEASANQLYNVIFERSHPFLEEHKSCGLPSRENFERYLNENGYDFKKVGSESVNDWLFNISLSFFEEANLIDESKLNELHTEYNRNFFGHFPLNESYRTVYLIKKGGVVPDLALSKTKNVDEFVKANYVFNVLEYFAKKMIFLEKDYQKEHKKLSESLEKVKSDHLKELTVKNEELKIKNEKLEVKDKELNSVKAENGSLQEEILLKELQIKQFNEDFQRVLNDVKKVKLRVEKLKKNHLDLKAEFLHKEVEYEALIKDLIEKEQTLNTILNSRSWKVVKIYIWLKQVFWLSPKEKIRKALKTLKEHGLKGLIGKIKYRRIENLNNLYEVWQKKNQFTLEKRKSALKNLDQYKYQPKISILMPVYKIKTVLLKKAIESVQSQVYKNWELCIVDDFSENSEIQSVLKDYAKKDYRIKVNFLEENLGISGATNEALKMASGEYVGFLDNDDELTPDALYEVVQALQETKWDMVYSDEDKIDSDGNLCEPFFKPDYSLDLLLSCNYICHFSVYKKDLVEKIGGLRIGYEGSQDYDLNLRFTELTDHIFHIPKILYHWRKVPGSAADSVDAKIYAYKSAKKALKDALIRRKVEGKVKDGNWKGSYRIIRKFKSKPLVSIIIPYKDKLDYLKRCIDSILKNTKYDNYEIILVDNNSEKPFICNPNNDSLEIRHYSFPNQFNFSAINNFAVKKAKGECLLFLNNDTEVTPGWLSEMVRQIQRTSVGICGCKLVYPNEKIQHAGVILGIGGVASHSHYHFSKHEHGYFGFLNVVRNYSAVTGACMITERSVFNEVGGFDEKLAVCFNDVDFCLKAGKLGYSVVYTPFAEVKHFESLSREKQPAEKEIELMKKRWGSLLQQDPFYNPNLTLNKEDFSLKIS